MVSFLWFGHFCGGEGWSPWHSPLFVLSEVIFVHFCPPVGLFCPLRSSTSRSLSSAPTHQVSPSPESSLSNCPPNSTRVLQSPLRCHGSVGLSSVLRASISHALWASSVSSYAPTPQCPPMLSHVLLVKRRSALRQNFRVVAWTITRIFPDLKRRS